MAENDDQALFEARKLAWKEFSHDTVLDLERIIRSIRVSEAKVEGYTITATPSGEGVKTDEDLTPRVLRCLRTGDTDIVPLCECRACKCVLCREKSACAVGKARCAYCSKVEPNHVIFCAGSGREILTMLDDRTQ